MSDLKVCFIQSDLYWENIKQNLNSFEAKILSINEAIDVLILPEVFTIGFTYNLPKFAEPIDGPSTQWMKDVAKLKNCVVIGSIIVKQDEECYNRLICAFPDGKLKTYDKRHLFRMSRENEFLSKGKERIIINVKGWKICPLVCYDLRFPVWSRNVYNNNEYLYDCLIYVANWPTNRSDSWNTLLKARAMENQAYVIGVNRIGVDGNNVSYSGDSRIHDPKGNKISKTEPNKESIEIVTLSYNELYKFRKEFPVGLDADSFEIL